MNTPTPLTPEGIRQLEELAQTFEAITDPEYANSEYADPWELFAGTEAETAALLRTAIAALDAARAEGARLREALLRDVDLRRAAIESACDKLVQLIGHDGPGGLNDKIVELADIHNRKTESAEADALRLREQVERLTPERCLCAALLCADGYIVRGHRHDDAIKVAGYMAEHGAPERDPRKSTQGFLTTRGRFVNRREGMDLEHQHRELVGDVLFSEDLY